MCVIGVTTVFSYFSTPPLILLAIILGTILYRHSEPLHQFVFIL